MNTTISSVIFKLVNSSTGQFIMEDVTMTEEDIIEVKDGVYTFKTTFNAPLDSSFGLDKNSFKTMVAARDSVGREEYIVEGKLPENIPSENFSMNVRVKERTSPHIETYGNWVSNQSDPNFIAEFKCWDQNSTYRLAGINKNSLEIYLNDIKQDIADPSSLFTLDENNILENPNYGKENGDGYIIRYPLENLEDGTYKIRAKIWDNDGDLNNDSNSSEVEGTITIKAEVPQLSIVSPENNDIFTTGEFTVSGSVNISSKIHLSLKKEGTVVYTEIINEDSLQDLQFTKLINLGEDLQEIEGEYVLEVYATNTHNPNVKSETIILNINIDPTPPQFFSVKFYPVGEDTPIDFTQEGVGLVAGTQYEIRVEVR